MSKMILTDLGEDSSQTICRITRRSAELAQQGKSWVEIIEYLQEEFGYRADQYRPYRNFIDDQLKPSGRKIAEAERKKRKYISSQRKFKKEVVKI